MSKDTFGDVVVAKWGYSCTYVELTKHKRGKRAFYIIQIGRPKLERNIVAKCKDLVIYVVGLITYQIPKARTSFLFI